MLKKRIIFTLLYDGSSFVLSRNFRLQKVGNLQWLEKYYDFKNISQHIDELIILNVGSQSCDINHFCEVLEHLSSLCFVPISAGGGIRSLDDAKKLMSSGADKLVLNTALFENLDLVKRIYQIFGQQAIVASLDCMKEGANFIVYTSNGSKDIGTLSESLHYLISIDMIGELYINSIDNDGTGQGYNLQILDSITSDCQIPVIISGGAGNSRHLAVGLSHPKIDAAATANLLNFVGDGLQQARLSLIEDGYRLARWNSFSILNP